MENRKEGLSKRQARREEIRRKERQQRMIVVGVGAVVVLVILAAFILPGILRSNETANLPLATVAPVSYTNADGTKLGDPNAPVKIDIFEDFQCTACEKYSQNIEKDVLNNLVMTGQAYYVFNNYPFLDDRNPSKDSDRAANAAYCAAEQNRFWDYKNTIFANWGEAPGIYTDARLKQFAEAIDLDMTSWQACYNENRYQPEIDKEIELGKQMGVTGTPSVFVNGVAVAPGKVPSYEEIRAAVEAAAAAP